MKYRVTNRHRSVRSYTAGNGQKIYFEPGETKELETPPPENDGYWSVEKLEEPKATDIEHKEGGEE